MIGNVASLATIAAYGIAGWIYFNPLDAMAQGLKGFAKLSEMDCLPTLTVDGLHKAACKPLIYASELAPWKRDGIDPMTGFVMLVVMAFVFGILAVAHYARKACGRIEQDKRAAMYADPDKNTHETPEDVWRRAYAESDGDHASYVKWRRK